MSDWGALTAFSHTFMNATSAFVSIVVWTKVLCIYLMTPMMEDLLQLNTELYILS